MLKPKARFDLNEVKARARKVAEGRKKQECWTCKYADVLDREGSDKKIIYCRMLNEYRSKPTDQLCLFYDISQN